MHTVHIILVQADSEAEAFERVAIQLEDSPLWSDWHEATLGTDNFAGRWSGGVFLTKDDLDLLEEDPAYEPSAPNILCYGDNPELAEDTLARFSAMKKQEMRESVPTGMPDLNDFIDSYNDYSEESIRYEMNIWRLKRLTQLLMNEWTPDSAIYDLESGYSSLHYFGQRVKENPHKQYLVPVDFHF
jgi:hypothetical protein